MSKLKLYFLELRAPFLTASIIPVLAGTAAAYRITGHFDLNTFLLFLAGAVLLHCGANVANDYYDHRNGGDEKNKDFIFPLTGGSRMIQQGLLLPKEVAAEFIVCYVLSAIVFAVLALKLGIVMILIWTLAVFSGIFYVAPPIFLAGRGLGELFIGLNLGVLLCCGAFFAQFSIPDYGTIISSISIAAFVTAILYANEFPDHDADLAAGKKHLVVRLGRRLAVWGYYLLMVIGYGSVMFGVLFERIPVLALSILITMPLAVISSYNLARYHSEPKNLAKTCVMTILIHLINGVILTAAYLIRF